MKIPKSLRWKSTGQTLGQGGQGVVHLVTEDEQENGIQFALKTLRNTKSQQALERFYREIDAVRQLDHPSIAKIVDHSGPGDSFHFYVMEYFEGAKTLEEVIDLDTNPYKENAVEALDLFRDILEVIHKCTFSTPSIVHRDLKPKNILILPDRTIRIIDFGVCQIEGAEPITLLDEGVGSQNYMAPECESGATGDITTLSDVYSAGKILWSAVTGRRAFARERPVFAEMSFESMYPDSYELWHLGEVFRYSVRHNPSDRRRPERLLWLLRKLRSSVLLQRPPLSRLAKDCPVCSFGTLYACDVSHMIFSNPMPRGFEGVKCNICGYAFAIDFTVLNDSLNKRRDME